MTTQSPIENGNKGTKSTAPTNVVANILLVSLGEIYRDAAFNARSGNWHEDPESADTPDGGFNGLLESLRASKTNTTPIELRPCTDEKKLAKGFKYELVAGFRRCRCAEILGWSHLRATVEEMSDLQARIRNIQEGTAHSNLKTADLAWAIGDLKDKGGKKLTDKDISNILGLSESYVSILRRVQTDIKKDITKTWRDSNLQINANDMLKLTVFPQEKQDTEFKKLCEGRDEKTGRKVKESPYVKLKDKVTAKGKELGILSQLKAIKVNDKAEWDVVIGELFNVPNSINAQQLVKLAQAMGDGYKEGLEAKLKTSESDEEESE